MAELAPAAQQFTFSLDNGVATGAIQIDPAANPALLATLVDGSKPLPDGDVLLIGGDLSVTPGQDITFGPAQVGFSADVNAALGVFSTPANLKQALVKNGDLVSQIGDNIDLPKGDKLLMLRWGYDISGTAAGSVALGPSANFSFSAGADTKGYFAMVQGVSKDAKALASLTTLIRSWRLPSQIDDISKMPVATTLISEVDGSFSLGAKVTFGYDFNWIRAIDGLALTGDIGLKLQAGLSASIGFGMTGKYAVLLSRETDARSIRMRLYKLKVKDWNFGFNASLTAQGEIPAPDKFDDLLKAITGTHGQQIMKLLGDVEDWTDPSKPIFGPFVNLADSEAQKLIQSVTGVADLAGAFDAVKNRILNLFQLWDNLPQTATQLIWSKLPDRDAIKNIAGIAQKVKALSDDDLKNFIQDKLADVPFLNSDHGRALESLAVDGLFSALQNVKEVANIREDAGLVADILDGDTLQSLLTQLQSAVNAKLDLSKLETVVDQASFDSLDTWLKARLEDFLEHDLEGAAGLAELTKLRNGLGAIVAKKDQLYSAALAAVRRSYDFSINSTYESTTTTSALLNMTFDFDVPNSQAGDGLKLALGGKFDQLLQNPGTGVTIKEGVLAFGVHKETHVSITLPHFATNSVHVNDAVAQLQTTSEDAGGLIFSLNASDVYTVKNNYSSGLTIALTAPGKQNRVRVHPRADASFQYDLKVAVPNLTSGGLSLQYVPYANTYFATEFKALPPGTFADWVNQIAPADGRFGNALITLNVSLPGSAAAAWKNAPVNERDAQYKKISIALQKQFKQILHDTFFSDVQHYKNVSGDTTARAVLTFCSIPACSDAELVNGGADVKFLDETADGKTIYWDFGDRGVNIFAVDLREKVLFHKQTQANLLALLRIAQKRLHDAGDPDGVLGSYADNQVGQILAAALHGKLIDFLFPVEAHMVEEARAAGLKLADFRTKEFTNPEKARQDLASFGQKLSDDFNASLKNFAVGNGLLPLGTAIYTAAAVALDPTSASNPAAMLTIARLKPGVSTLTPADTDILHTDRVVHVR